MSTERREKELADHLLRPIGVRVSDLTDRCHQELVEGRIRSVIEQGRDNELANSAQWKDESGRKQ